MKHKDGIECYLKPRGQKHAERKFREIPQETESDDDFLMHSVVLKTHNTFNVAMRFSDAFDMSSASALHVVVGLKTANRGRSLHTSLASVSQVRSGILLVNKVGTWGYPFNGLKTSPGDFISADLSTDYYPGSSPGDTVISVERGHPAWKDANHKDHAFGPQGQSKYYHGTFRPLPGDMGVAYIFRFTPQSTDTYRETSERCHVPLSAPPRVTGDAYTADAEFDATYRSSLAFLQDIRLKGLEKDQKEREAARLRRTNLVASEAPPASNKDTPLDRDVQEAPSSRQARPVTLTDPQSNNELREVPICSCPRTHPTQSGKSATLKIATPAEESQPASKGKTKQRLTEKPGVTSADDTATSDETVKADDGAQETVAKQCMSCKKFKKPPAGKKITYRRVRGRYMCVPRDAHNEAGPVDTVTRRTVSETNAQTRPTSEPDQSLADSMEQDSASFAAPRDPSPEQEISPSETSQSVFEESYAEPPDSQSPVATGFHEAGADADETSPDEPSITSADSTTVSGTEEAKSQPLSTKRPATAEPSNDEQPPAKQPRIEESIPPHHKDNQVVVSIKIESGVNPDDLQFIVASPQPSRSKTKREKGLEENLARKKRELREIRLEKEIEDLQRQLAAEQRRKAKQNAIMPLPVKEEEEEVIELD